MSNRNYTIKKAVMLSTLALLVFNSCVSRSDYDKVLHGSDSLQTKCDSLHAVLENEREIVAVLNKTIVCLSDSVKKLQYPADQRLENIINLIRKDSLDLATIEIENLKVLFPYSKEVKNIHLQTETINKRREAIKKEQERIKALGFKVLKDKSIVWEKKSNGDEIKYTFSNFHFGSQFTFNYINDISEYYYRTANKGNTYILADMSIYTKSDYAYAPSVYACAIVDGKLSQIGYFTSEYESYDTYGEYLGNYADTSHDFSKVNTVKYNIAAQISQDEAKCPIVILMKKDNELKSVDGLTVSEVSEKCEVIRILNRAKL